MKLGNAGKKWPQDLAYIEDAMLLRPLPIFSIATLASHCTRVQVGIRKDPVDPTVLRSVLLN